jgi:tetratricopeptide (TPR) repeat protein
MESTRWTRIQELFHAAVDLSGEEQRQVVESACANDESLSADVLALLDEDARAGSALDGGLARAAGGVLDSDWILPALEELSAYRFERVLGEGGMGVVYLAERKDVGRRVALKVLRDAWLSPARRERFAIEQRTLAQLDHPAIARLFDSGVLADGTPYFVMEYVEGESITDHCVRRDARLPERLRLFRTLCEAVQSAHAHAFIHRDIKPSNVLVKRDGTLRLLDFGIAKQLESMDALVSQTRTGLRLMTPAYASPEQFRGDRVGVQTDIYSLGVVLYELLTGKLPFDLRDCSPAAAERLIVEREPENPSVAALRTPAAALTGKSAWADLDVLVLTAMHKDPARRYRSTDALIRDLDHFSRNEPLDARPDTLGYRLGKFLRRNRRAVALAGSALLIAAGLAVFFTVRLARARDSAVAEAGRAEHVQSFMLNLLEGGETESGPAADLRVLTILERGAKEAAALGAEPQTQAALYVTLGSMYQKLGQHDRADALLQQGLERHRALRHADDSVVGQDLIALGLLRLDQARMEESLRLVREGVALVRRGLPREHPAVARALMALGKVLLARNLHVEASQVAKEAVELRSSGLDRAAALALLADVVAAGNDFSAAVQLNDQAIHLYRSQLGAQHPLIADRHAALAAEYVELGRPEEGLRHNRLALEIVEAWYGPDHTRTAAALTALAVGMGGGVLMKRSQGKDEYLVEAEPMLLRALAIQERVHGPVHPAVAEVVYALGLLALHRGRYDEAIEYLVRTEDIERKTVGELHTDYAVTVLVQGAVNLVRGNYVRAEELLRRADAIYEAAARSSGNVAEGDGTGAFYWGTALLGQGKLKEAETASLAAYDIFKKRGVFLSGLLPDVRANLAAIYDGLGEPEKAARFRAELAAANAPPSPAPSR